MGWIVPIYLWHEEDNMYILCYVHRYNEWNLSFPYIRYYNGFQSGWKIQQNTYPNSLFRDSML